MRNLPPSWVNGAQLRHCLVSDGVVIQCGSKIECSVIGIRSRIGKDVTMRDTVMLGADRLETDAERTRNRERGVPNFNVGDGAVVERAILDKDCRIGKGARIVNARGVEEEEGPNYVIREGIVVIPRGAVVPDGAVI